MKLPLYYQVYNALRSRIDSGEYAAGGMLPTEQELMEAFKASRAPIRQALGMLENEGVIKRRPGRGTFVCSPPEDVLLWFNFSPFREAFSKDWEHISCRTFIAEMRRPPEEARNFLLLGAKEKTVYLERVRFVRSRPVIFHQHYIHPSIDLCAIKKLGDLISVRAALRDEFSVEITRIVDSLQALAAPEGAAAYLDLEKDAPVLRAERRSFSHDAPFQFDFFYTRTDVWNYTVAFEKGINGTTAASQVDVVPNNVNTSDGGTPPRGKKIFCKSGNGAARGGRES